ncbi:MAG: hypothetical protein ACREC5_01115 [Thermoplasmata archaeon]
MRTYVRMIFDSEGAAPAQVLKVLRELGFEESMGMHDFVYTWKERAEFDRVLALITSLHERLKGNRVLYEVTTIS